MIQPRGLPLAWRANFTACSLASAPPRVKNTRPPSNPDFPSNKSARRARGSAPHELATKHSFSACSRIARTTWGCWCPRLQHSLRLLKSRIVPPFSAIRRAPRPPTIVGASQSVCLHQLWQHALPLGRHALDSLPNALD